MNIEQWFSVDVGYFYIPEDVKNEVSAKVKDWMDRNSKNDLYCQNENLHTTYYSNRSFLDSADLHSLKSCIIEGVNKYLNYINKDTKYTIDSWINIFEKNENEIRHYHHGAIVSGCYYVQAVKSSGDFVIPDPIEIRRCWAFHNKIDDKNPINSEVSYEPESGKIILFPSWMPHYVKRNHSEVLRISIAFNVNILE